MKVNYIHIIFSVLLLLNFKAEAQTESQFTNYMYNVQQFNPAYVGIPEHSVITGTFRSQWTGLEGAPETQWLSFGTPLANNRMGLGLNLMHDKIGPSSYKNFSLVYAYNLRLNESMKLSLGVNGGGSFLDVDFTKGQFETPGDIAKNNVNNEFYARVGAGAILSADDWFLGFSVPNFFKQDFYDAEVRNVVADKMQYNLFAGYMFYLNRNLALRPSVLANVVEGNPITLNANANFLLFDRLSLGLGYRYDESINGMAGFKILNELFVGYSYDFATNDFSDYHNGSHEIVIRFKFNKNDFNFRNALNSY